MNKKERQLDLMSCQSCKGGFFAMMHIDPAAESYISLWGDDMPKMNLLERCVKREQC